VYTPLNSGLPENTVTSIAIDGFGNKWIGTTANGVSVFKEGGVILSTVEAQKYTAQKAVSLTQNYPNPFSTTTTINYRVTEPGFVSLKVFDAMGTEVACLVNERNPVGDYSIDWNASGMANGIYLCKLQLGNYFEVGKMQLLK